MIVRGYYRGEVNKNKEITSDFIGVERRSPFIHPSIIIWFYMGSYQGFSLGASVPSRSVSRSTFAWYLLPADQNQNPR